MALREFRTELALLRKRPEATRPDAARREVVTSACHSRHAWFRRPSRTLWFMARAGTGEHPVAPIDDSFVS